MDGAYYAQAVERFLTRAQEPQAFLQPSLGDPSFGQARPEINEAPPKAFFKNARFVGELAGRLWICEGQGGTLLVLDPHAVRERVFLNSLKGASRTPQRTLFSTTVNVGPTQAKQLADLMPQLAALGVEIEPFGSNAFAVKTLPLPCEDVPALLNSLTVDFERAEQWLAHYAVAPGRTASATEVHALLAALDDVDFSQPCLHGSVVVHQVPLLNLTAKAFDGN